MSDSESGDPRPPEAASTAEFGDQRWVSIYTCRSREEAHLAVAKLRDQGIQARTDGEEMSMAGLALFAGPGSVTLMDAKVQVLASDAPAARAVLEEVDRRRIARLGRLPCPKCGAIKPDRTWAKPRLAAIAGVGIAVTLLSIGVATLPAVLLAFVAGCGVMWPYTPRWRCMACGHVWIAPDPDSQVEDDDEDDEAAEADEGKAT